MKRIRSLFFYVNLFVSTILFGSAAICAARLTKGGEWSHLVARLWGKVNLWAAGVKVETSGLERIDPGKPYIYAANHQSLFDIFVILGYLPVQFRWLAKEELFKVFMLGRAMAATGYIPIDRTDRRKAFDSLNRAAEKVREGTSIVIFPEGTRSTDGVLKDFKKGGFVLAIKSQQPIVPIGISGSHRVHTRREGWVIHPGVVRMTVGKPIPTSGATVHEKEHLMASVRRAIQEHLAPEEAGGDISDRRVTIESATGSRENS